MVCKNSTAIASVLNTNVIISDPTYFTDYYDFVLDYEGNNTRTFQPPSCNYPDCCIINKESFVIVDQNNAPLIDNNWISCCDDDGTTGNFTYTIVVSNINSY